MSHVCQLHKVDLQHGGKRLTYAGLFHAPSYTAAENKLFPQANALRIASCANHSRGKPRATYCPECRKALRKWAQETSTLGGPEADLANRFLLEILDEDPECPPKD